MMAAIIASYAMINPQLGAEAFFAEVILPKAPLGTTDLKLLQMLREAMGIAFGKSDQRKLTFYLKASPIDPGALRKKYDLRRKNVLKSA